MPRHITITDPLASQRILDCMPKDALDSDYARNKAIAAYEFINVVAAETPYSCECVSTRQGGEEAAVSFDTMHEKHENSNPNTTLTYQNHMQRHARKHCQPQAKVISLPM